MKYTLNKKVQKPFLYSKDSIITEVNNEFINFTGYAENELIGKSLTEISNMLRIGSQVYLENIENEYSCYMFTKECESREVTISCKKLQGENEKIYFVKEKPNSRIEDKLQYAVSLLSNNVIAIAIYSIVDGILLKNNKKYLDFWNTSYNEKKNTIGYKPEDIFTGYKGSSMEKIFLDVIKTGKPYYSRESKDEYLENGHIYWDVSLVSIYVSGKAKYVVHTVSDITEKVVNRKLVQEQKNEQEAIIQNMSDGLFIADKDYNYSILNNSARDYANKHSPMKRVGDTLSNTKYYDLEGNLMQIENFPVYRALKGERIKEFRIISHISDGIYHYNVSGSPLYDENGNIEKALLCISDVTEQVNKEELIRQQNEQLEAIIENISDELIIFDKNCEYTTLNKKARENPLFNVTELKSSESFVEQAENFDIDGNIILNENFPSRRIMRGEKVSEYRIVSKNNKGIDYKEVSGTPIYDSEGNFSAGLLIFHNITDRLKNEENLLLKTQYDLLNRMIENLDLGFIRCSYPEFKITDMNNKIYNNLKKINPKVESLSSIIGGNVLDTLNFNSDEKVELKINILNLIEKKFGSYCYYRKAVIEGEEKFYKIMWQPLFGLNNQIMEMVIIAIDVTEEVKAKNQMEKNLKMQEEIFANISHELKTPLNVIFSTTQLFKLYLKNDSLIENKDKISKGINIVRQNCYRLTKLINNIVDISKIDSGYFELNLSNENIVNITEDIIQSVSEYIKVKGLSITFDTNIEEKIIACDPDKIERIILNLISNAIKFSNSEGSIFVNILDKGDTVEIEVKDTGIGIDNKHLDNIFERFHQVDKSLSRNAEGSGIGLSVVKSIVELHGGKISAESKPGEGSIFKIKLPARTVEEPIHNDKNKPMSSKVEMINIEFSDIYSI